MPSPAAKKHGHRVLLSFAAVVLVSFAALSAVGWQVHQNREQAKQTRELVDRTRTLTRQNQRAAKLGKQAHDALCALNQRNIARIRASTTFLDEHPEGIPGIPAKLILDQIKGDQSTVAVLNRTLGHCAAPTPPH